MATKETVYSLDIKREDKSWECYDIYESKETAQKDLGNLFNTGLYKKSHLRIRKEEL